MKLLLIEDDLDLCTLLQSGLTQKGYLVETTQNGTDGYYQSLTYDFDLIILDLNLPGMNGLDLLEKLRKEKPNQRILILSAQNSVDDRIRGLDLGANDYLGKPFSFQELDARIRALLRRNFLQSDPSITWKSLRLDTAARQIFWNESLIELKPKEYMILEYLMYHIGVTISSEELIEHIWDSETNLFSMSIKTHMSRLRKQLFEQTGCEIIMTIRGRGYLIPQEDMI